MVDALGLIRGVGPAETTETINRLYWSGAGTMVENGATYAVDKYVYALSLSLTAAREDIQRTAGGSKTRRVQVVHGQQAWDESTPGVGLKLAHDQARLRRLQFARTPFGFAKAVLRAPPGSVKVRDGGPSGQVSVTATIEGVPTTAILDRDFRPQLISMNIDGRTIQTSLTRYRDISEYGIMFPSRIVEKVNSKTVLDLTIDDGRTSTYAIFRIPSNLR
jgi:hypothetical protein